ncbi:MAG: UDP-2,3-diacylglucosamine diphosphatase [candidate division WOR-3 bacterium]
MKIYLFSDAHFGFFEDEKEKFEKFRILLEMIKRDADKFIIVGDLFDFWFEYESVIFSNYFKVLSEIYLVSKNVETIYIAGNHDLWIGNFFEKLNIKPIIGIYEMKINNKKIVFAHGDDLKFRIKTRDILRNPILIKLFKMIHPDLGIKLAKFVSKASRKAHDDYPEKIPNWLWDYFERIEGDVLIVGHLHSPLYDIRNGKKILCIGDWIKHFTYGIINNDEVIILSISGEVSYTLKL